MDKSRIVLLAQEAAQKTSMLAGDSAIPIQEAIRTAVNEALEEACKETTNSRVIAAIRALKL